MAVDLKLFSVNPTASIYDVIEVIQANGREFAVVVDSRSKVLGTVTDGDIRRAILKNIDLTKPVKKIMNPNPITIGVKTSHAAALHLMKKHLIRQLPVTRPSKKLVDVLFIHDLVADHRLRATAVIMAGGLGNRLRPLTKETPKPMLQVGEKPILETIIEQLRGDGIKDIYISINYKGKQIQSHFGAGGKFGVQIKYLKEKKRMGTAGALGFIPPGIDTPLLVMNADLLTRLNFQGLLEYHEKGSYDMTVTVKEYDYQVPYGVVCIGNDHTVTGIDEKPVQHFFVNAGIYVLSPSCLSMIQSGEFMDITTLIARLLRKKKKVGAFPIQEYWLDIGLHKDFEKANRDYKIHFNKNE